MGSQRSKEDEVLKISTSVFVTNFPDQTSAKDLLNACKQYGHVVDAFIPNKRSKTGKRFGFVRFIKVFDVERLVGNLCTVWIGSHIIHVHVARFHRLKGFNSSRQPNQKGEIRDTSNGIIKDNAQTHNASSYAYVVKNRSQENGESDSKPVLVLDDSCVNKQDYSCCLNGKVKEFRAFKNLKVVLGNEGFTDIELRYLGGMWVMMGFDSVEVKEKFLFSTGSNSWFSQLIQTSSDFTIDGRVTVVEIEGKTHWVRAIAPDFDDQNDKESDSEDEGFEGVFKEDFGGSEEEVQGGNDVSRVPDTLVEKENPKSKDGGVSSDQNGIQSEDLFNIYSLLNKNKMKKNKEASTKESLEYPPGFTPREDNVGNIEVDNLRNNYDGDIGNVRIISDEVNSSPRYNTDKKEAAESMDSEHCRKSEGSRKGGSILTLMDELVKVGQTMGYNMEGCMKNIEEIIESQGMDGVFR
ncbi:nucleotide-binding alpha-beta plait domain-containing protein [Tanacetum coccineum]